MDTDDDAPTDARAVVDVAVLPGFVAVVLLFLLPPGPDMAFMIAVGLERGRRSAAGAILGIGTGMAVYAAAVVVGVGEVARSHPLFLDVVKVCGAAYLLWLAYGTLRHTRRTSGGPRHRPGARPYLRGVVVSLSNPKLLLFFLAVLPQFIGSATSTGWQLAMLGAIDVLVEVVLYGAIGVLAGSFQARFTGSLRAGTALDVVAGSVYVVLAVVVIAEVVADPLRR